MKPILKLPQKLFSHQYYIGALVFSIMAYVLLVSPYSSNNGFDLETTFFSFTTIISAAIALLSFHYTVSGKKGFGQLFNISLGSLLLSLFALPFIKTVSFLYAIETPVMFLAILMFFVTLQELVSHVE